MRHATDPDHVIAVTAILSRAPDAAGAYQRQRSNGPSRLRRVVSETKPTSSACWWFETGVSCRRSSITVGRDLVERGSIAIVVRPSATKPCHAAERAALIP